MIWYLLGLFVLQAVTAYRVNEVFPFQQVQNGTFSFPPSGITNPSDYASDPVYTDGQTVKLSWTTSMAPPYDVLLAQPLLDGTYIFSRLAQNKTLNNGLNWTVSGDDLGGDAIGKMFFVAVFQSGSMSDYFTSHFFNVSGTPSSTSTTAPSAATATTTVTALNIVSAPSSTPTSPADATTPPPQTEKSPGISIGLAIGVTVGATLVLVSIICAVFWIVRSKRKRHLAAEAAKAPAMMTISKGVGYEERAFKTVYHPTELHSVQYWETGQPLSHEMEVTERMVELPSEPPKVPRK